MQYRNIISDLALIESGEDSRSRINRLEELTRTLSCEIGLIDSTSHEFSKISSVFNPDMKFQFRGFNDETFANGALDLPGSPPERAVRKLRFEDDLISDHCQKPLQERTQDLEEPVADSDSTLQSNKAIPERPSANTSLGHEGDKLLSITRKCSSAEPITSHIREQLPRNCFVKASPSAKLDRPAGTRSWLRRTGKQHNTVAQLQDPEAAELASQNRLCIVFATTVEPR